MIDDIMIRTYLTKYTDLYQLWVWNADFQH